MAGITAKFDINNDKIAEPKLYLGVNVEKFRFKNGKYAWSIISNSYVQGDIDTVKRIISEDVKMLNIRKRPHKGPLTHGYNPEMDTTGECDTDHTLRYQQLIGIFLWTVDLGRIDIQL